MSEQPYDDEDEVYDLDAAFQAVRKRPFKFRFGGVKWELPHFSEIDYRAAGLMDELSAITGADNVANVDLDILRKIFSYGFDPAQRARWDDQYQPSPAIGLLFEQWQQHSGEDLGESSGSTNSSGSTAEPLSQTSASSTTSGSKRRSTVARRNGTQRGS
ncbi:hypothetical protein BDK92_7248 [Micromonospora pisi]|uniref:Tail assembly chaperone n=1 Tax=Micromonospora pisi TaxID=589240 RepID=A0A495JW09_9ACTN|nr:hypothetical protein [Micromonospora pisi]RKR92768.1 hypothetical protein BDK92_7248 [Micromonospora pisi]